MINILYTLIIFPIEQVIEICFFCGKAWFGSLGLAIIGVSVAVSTFVLPVYLMAEKQQRRQREIEKDLKAGVDLINSVFKGDERFMLLSTYYRQNNYHPIFALRNSLELIIQVPFFIAAYQFLYNLDVLNGTPFLFISDLGHPDNLLFGLNILPIVMTAINILSGMIYAKDLAEKDKIQLYLMAGVFLALLYDSPAGLVLYWTGNNIYGLVKNIIQNRIKRKKHEKQKSRTEIADNALNDRRTFILSLLALMLLIGFVIPSGVISSGVDEFSYSTTGVFVSPFRFIVHTILQAGGFFLWGICLYVLFQGRTRAILTASVVSLLIMSAMDTFVYSGSYGFLTRELVLSNYRNAQPTQQIASIATIIALSSAAVLLMSIKRKRIIISVLAIVVISFAILGITDVVKTNAAFTRLNKYETYKNKNGDYEIYKNKNGDVDTLEKVFNFSKNGKNIIILMMDRMISLYLPFIFEEKPELMNSFRGFTYYPNMVSYGGFTFCGAAPLFGGYYCTPYEMQKRIKQPLKDKYNECVQVLPRIMAQNNITVSVTNPPIFGDFADIHSTTEEFVKQIFSDVENIEATDIIHKYYDRYKDGLNFKIKGYDSLVKKKLFQFSLFKCSPYVLRTDVYNNGNYMIVDNLNVNNLNNDHTGDYNRGLLENYLSLLLYPQLTRITDDDKNNCVIAVNELTHESGFFQYPDYQPITTVTNRGNGIFANDPVYHVNMLGTILISKWLNYLKENGIWDNTRIIIMSDHGHFDPDINIPTNISLPDRMKLQRYNGVLLVKDFGASEKELSVDSVFMTSADVPAIATKDIINNPKNPFTSEPLYTDKDSGVVIPITHWKRESTHSKYRYDIKDDEWLKVRENVFKKENWTKYSVKE